MNFYTDDSPGLKIPPVRPRGGGPLSPSCVPRSRAALSQVLVLVVSVIFILAVTVLHVIGKVRRG